MSFFLKFFGERHTGTKYAARLVEANFEDIYVIEGRGLDVFEKLPSRRLIDSIYDAYFRFTYPFLFGWKHSAAPSRETLERYWMVQENVVQFAFIVRDPYSWLLSLHRVPYDSQSLPRRFEDFLQAPWKTRSRDGCGSVSSPIELWNVKNRSYLNSGFPMFRFEELVTDPEMFIKRVGMYFRLDMRDRFVDHENSTVAGSDRKSAFYKAYYRLEEWTGLLSREALETIGEGVDWDLAGKFGYRRR
jgi:hypothetical protein